MTNTFLWTAFYVLIALVVLAVLARGMKRIAQRRHGGDPAHRMFHDH